MAAQGFPSTWLACHSPRRDCGSAIRGPRELARSSPTGTPGRPVATLHAHRQVPAFRLAEKALVGAALGWLSCSVPWVDATQARVTEIPAPRIKEEAGT